MRVRFISLLMALFVVLLPIVAQDDDGLEGALPEESELMLTVLSEPVVDNNSGEVTVDFIVTDDGIPIVDLTDDAVTLSESSENIRLTRALARQLHLAIAVDLSFGSDGDLVRDSLRAFFDNYYLEGDDITLYIVDAQVPDSESFRIVQVDSLATANDAIDAMSTSPRFFSVEPMLLQIFSDLQDIPDTPMTSRQLLFVGSFLNRPADAQNARNFAEANIAVHGVQAHRTREDFTTTYRGLTNIGEGLFANNIDGIFVIPGDVYQPINNLKVLYDSITNARFVYTVQWITRNSSLNSVRDVDLQLQVPSGSSVTETVNYEFEFVPPEVTFINQRSFDITRQVTRADDLSPVVGIDSLLVPILVTFPDTVARPLASVRLDVVDVQSQEILDSELLISPESDNGEFVLTWDLTPFDTLDSQSAVELVVVVQDTLDLTAEARTAGSVNVPSPPALPTQTPLPTPIVTQVVAASGANAQAVTDGDSQTVGDSGTETITAQTLGDALPLVGLLLSLIVLLVIAVLYLLVRSSRLQREASQAPVVAASTQTEDTQPPLAPITDASQQGEYVRYAQLVALDDTSKQINIEHLWIDQVEMSLGRSDDCDIVIKSPILDNRHCLIKVKNNDAIYIRDLGSINGTFVNGVRIEEGEDEFLPQNTEFSLTKQLKFKLLAADVDLKEDDKLSTIAKSTVYSSVADVVPFKSLEGDLTYAEDDGPPIDENYSPV